jgi:hypothetical protein
LATQFSATPPARQASRWPVTDAAWRAIRSTISSVTSWIERARSSSRRVISLSGSRAGPSKSASKARLVIFSPPRKPK